MILTRLTLTDFGVFRGRQVIDLLPRPSRPVILFGGKNGAGKTTLLEAIQLCLYGPGALGSRVGKETYLAHLEKRIHSNPNLLIQPMFASIALEFQYADAEGLQTYIVTRSWERRGPNRIVEHLHVDRDGKALDELAGEHWQEFVRELVPPGVAQLFFFDGERIQQLAEDTSDQATLADAIKTLLGLNVVERLRADLDIFESRLTTSGRDGQYEREVDEHKLEIANGESGLRALREARKNQEVRLDELRDRVARIEAKIGAEGGAFVRNRETLLQHRASLRARIDEHESSLRQRCGSLLPFALVPGLCEALRTQLLREQEATHLAAGKRMLDVVRQEVCDRLKAADIWESLSNSPYAVIHELQERLTQKVREPFTVEAQEEVPLIHELSPSTQRQVLNWIDQCAETGQAVRSIADDLERFYRELHKVEDDLRKIPADDVLKPLLGELQETHAAMSTASMVASRQDDEIKAVELGLNETQRRYAQASDKMVAQQSHASKLRLIPRIHKALTEYQSRLIDRKVVELQASFTECFNVLCRKKDALRKIVIDPMTFAVTLYDRQMRALPKAQLSAGEKQIYAIAMLWALAKTSGRSLPIIIDTPLARLDNDHRSLMSRQYFPRASHQILILSTDTEVDRGYFADLRPRIAHAYHLEFDMNESMTRVSPGYFWKDTHEA